MGISNPDLSTPETTVSICLSLVSNETIIPLFTARQVKVSQRHD
jgi:hypothetical protein